MASASERGSLERNHSPLSPWRTASRPAQTSLTITGVPRPRASSTVRGWPSYQTDGKTSARAPRSTAFTWSGFCQPRNDASG